MELQAPGSDPRYNRYDQPTMKKAITLRLHEESKAQENTQIQQIPGIGLSQTHSSTTITRTQSLNTNSQTNLLGITDEPIEIHIVGTKHYNNEKGWRKIYSCLVCNLPVLIYGRFSPCQHSICYSCSEGNSTCTYCHSPAEKIEKVGETEPIFICEHDSCKRSYLNEYSFTEHQKLRGHGITSHQTQPIVFNNNNEAMIQMDYNQPVPHYQEDYQTNYNPSEFSFDRDKGRFQSREHIPFDSHSLNLDPNLAYNSTHRSSSDYHRSSRAQQFQPIQYHSNSQFVGHRQSSYSRHGRGGFDRGRGQSGYNRQSTHGGGSFNSYNYY